MQLTFINNKQVCPDEDIVIYINLKRPIAEDFTRKSSFWPLLTQILIWPSYCQDIQSYKISPRLSHYKDSKEESVLNKRFDPVAKSLDASEPDSKIAYTLSRTILHQARNAAPRMVTSFC